MTNKISFEKNVILYFLEAVSNVTDTATLLIKDGKINAITNNQDASLICWANMAVDSSADVRLNLPSVKKLKNAIKLCSDDVITFKINNNNLEYKGKSIKFKYHLHDDGVVPKSKISLDMIKKLKFDINFEFSKSFVKDLLKITSVFSGTNKLYIYTDDSNLMWDLKDETMSNTDKFSLTSGSVDFELDPFIMNLDNLRMIKYLDDDVCRFRINTELGVGNINLKSDKIVLNYIISSLVK